MKFQTILLLAATATFALANNNEVSDLEDIAPANVDDIAPADDIPATTEDNNTMEDAGIASDLDENIADTAFEDTPSTDNVDVSNISDIADANEMPENADANDIPEVADTMPGQIDDMSKPETEAADAAEASDDYGDNLVNQEDANAADVAENSDDYGDAEAPQDDAMKVDDLDAADVADANIEDMDAAEQSADEEDNSAMAAVGLAGAAALSSAGIFLWVKKSKKDSLENSPLNMA